MQNVTNGFHRNGLRARREAAGLSRERLAFEVGCSGSTVQQVEGGWRCSADMAQKIAAVLGCEAHELHEMGEGGGPAAVDEGAA